MGSIRSTAVDMDGLFRLLGEHLYSTPAVAIRELVQNAHDSIVRRRAADPDWGRAAGGCIRLRPDPAKRRLVISDDGAGLTGTEVTEHLATLGAGATRLAREDGVSDELIGMFGIGFLSAFVIAERVIVTTTSHREPGRTWRYVSKDGQRYSLDEVEATHPVGTEVELWLDADARNLAEPNVVRSLVGRYCALLRTPVVVGADPTAVNADRPPWEDGDGSRVAGSASLASAGAADAAGSRDSALAGSVGAAGDNVGGAVASSAGSDLGEAGSGAGAAVSAARDGGRRGVFGIVGAEPGPVESNLAARQQPVQGRKRRLAFAGRFERFFEPLLTVDIPRDPEGLVEGLVWVQDAGTYGNNDNRNVSLFVNGMLVDDDARDFLPRWAGFAGAVLSSYKLQPTASREDVARTDDHREAVAWVAEQLIAGLAQAAAAQPEAWQTVLSRHNEALLGAALTDKRLFDLLADDLTVPTSEGDRSVAALRSAGQGTIYVAVAVDEGIGFEQTVLRALHVPVASGNRYAVLPFLRAWVDARGGQLAELGTGSGDAALFKPEPLDADTTKWLEEALAGPGEEVVPARFRPAGLPLAVVPDREAAVKARIEDDDAARRIASGVLALARLRTAAISDRRVAHLYVNLANPAVDRLLELRPDRDHSAVRLLRALKQLGGGGGGDLAPALSDATATVVELLDAAIDPAIDSAVDAEGQPGTAG